MKDFIIKLKKSSIPLHHHKTFIKAAKERYAWTIGDYYDIYDLDCLIEDFGGENINDSEYCWVNKRGEIFKCLWSKHDDVAACIFGMRPEQMEIICARVNLGLSYVSESWDFVYRPTKRMKAAVWTHMLKYEQTFRVPLQYGEHKNHG